MSHPEHQQEPERPIQLRPGESQFLLAAELEAAGQSGSAALMYERAMRLNYANVDTPVEIDRGLIAVAKEKSAQAWRDIAVLKRCEGEDVEATLADGRAQVCESFPESTENWDLGLSDDELEQLEVQLRAEIR